MIRAPLFEDMAPLRVEHVPKLGPSVFDTGFYAVGIGETGATGVVPAIDNTVAISVRSQPITVEKVRPSIGSALARSIMRTKTTRNKITESAGNYALS